jgi:hypothetical protein
MVVDANDCCVRRIQKKGSRWAALLVCGIDKVGYVMPSS